MEPNNIGNLIHRPAPELSRDENNRKKVLIVAGIVVVVAVLGFGGYKIYQKRKLAIKIAGPKFEIPQVKTEIKILKVLEKKSKQILETQDIHSGEKVGVFIPEDVKPNFIGVKDIQKDYVLELFKYQPTANNLVALSLDVVKDFPATKLFPMENSLISGTVSTVGGGVIVIFRQSPGQEKAEYQKVAIDSHTTYTRLTYVGKVAVEESANLVNIKKGSGLNVFYNKKDSTPDMLKASRVEIITLGAPNIPSKQ